METSQLESNGSLQRGYALGIDIGGTFTDVLLLSADGSQFIVMELGKVSLHAPASEVLAHLEI